MTMLVRTHQESADASGAGDAPAAQSLLWALLFAAAIAAIAWLAWPGNDGATVDGDLAAIGAGEKSVVTGEHALLELPSPSRWSIVADGESLGRGGSTITGDLRTVFGSGIGAREPVLARVLRSGAIAWASPRQVWLIDPAVRDDVARIDVCGNGVDALAQSGERLLVAACGRVSALGPDGSMRWRTDRADRDDPRTRLLALDGRVAFGHAGARTVEMVAAADGERVWRRRLEAPLRTLVPIDAGSLAYVARDEESTRVGVLDASDGTLRWQRRWRGWRETAVASDGRRVVVGFVDAGSGEQCGSSGMVDLDSRTGAANATRRLDSRLQVAGLGADAATSRMVALLTGRSCTLRQVEPRIDVLRARGLDRVHQVALPSRPCSNLAVRGRLAVVASCTEAFAVDTLTGARRWTVPAAPVPSRRSIAISMTGTRVVLTDDVGTLAVLEPPG